MSVSTTTSSPVFSPGYTCEHAWIPACALPAAFQLHVAALQGGIQLTLMPLTRGGCLPKLNLHANSQTCVA